jgi:hypothetical protein
MSITFKESTNLYLGLHYKASTDTYTRIFRGINEADSYNFFPASAAVGDNMTFCANNSNNHGKFHKLTFDVATAVAATGLTVIWEYAKFESTVNVNYGAKWLPLQMVTDNTNAFQNTGVNEVTWKVPEDWENYVNPVSGHTGSQSGHHYYWCVRARITALTSMTNVGLHAVDETVVTSVTMVVANESAGVTFEDMYEADKAGTNTMISRTGLTAIDSGPVNNSDMLRPADYYVLGGALLDLSVGTFSGFTSATVQITGTDENDNAQTEDIVFTGTGSNNTTKYFKTITTTELTSVTGTGTIDYDLIQNQWGVMSRFATGDWGFKCNWHTSGTTIVNTKGETITFATNWYSFVRSQIVSGELYGGTKAFNGSTFIFDMVNADMSNCYLMQSDGIFYNTTVRCINLEDTHNHGFWGGAIGADPGQVLNDVTLESFRNTAFSNKANVIKGVKVYNAHSEPTGAIIDDCKFFGADYGLRPLYNSAYDDSFTHYTDLGDVTIAPVNPWEVDRTADYRLNLVGCTYGTYALADRVRWRLYASVDTDAQAHFKTPLVLKAIQEQNGAIPNADVSVIDNTGVEVFSCKTSPDGYLHDYEGTVTSATATSLTDSGQSWATDELFAREVIITSGTGAGQRRIIKQGNTSTTIEPHVDFAVTPDTTSKFIIIPYILTSVHSPEAYVAGTDQDSIVVDYSPFKVIVKKSGYNSYIEKVTLDEPVDKSVTMKRSRLDLT